MHFIILFFFTEIRINEMNANKSCSRSFLYGSVVFVRLIIKKRAITVRIERLVIKSMIDLL